MTLNKKILLIPSITPLLLVLIVSGLNLNKQVNIKLLTWRSPSLSLGVCMTLGGCTGALIAASAGMTMSSDQRSLRRKVNYMPNQSNDNQSSSETAYRGEYSSSYSNDIQIHDPLPERDLRDPYPTISVPFRVINNRKDYDSSNHINDTNTHDNHIHQSIIEQNLNTFNDEEVDLMDSNEDWGVNLEDEW